MIVKKAVLAFLFLVLVAPAASAVNETDAFTAAGALYTKSVDLANAGNYTGALEAADQALAYNQSSLLGLIQSNRAGVLVMLKRYDQAIDAADTAIAVQGNLTSVHAIAYYNKGNALLALGRTAEARAAFEKAHQLDSTLVSPLGPAATTTTAKSPISPGTAVAAGILAGAVMLWRTARR